MNILSIKFILKNLPYTKGFMIIFSEMVLFKFINIPFNEYVVKKFQYINITKNSSKEFVEVTSKSFINRESIRI